MNVVAREPPRPRPLLVPAIALMAGIGLSNAVGPLPALWRSALLVLPVVALVALLLALWRRAHRYVLLGLAVTIALAAGVARHQQVYDRPPHHIARALADEPVLTRLAGRIVTTPIERPPLKLNPFLPFNPAPRTQFVLAVEEVRTADPPIAATGQVRVSAEAADLGLRLGQRVQVTGRLWRPFGQHNPGEMDWSRWFRQQRIDAGLSVEGRAHVVPLSDEVSPWYGLVTALRSRAQSLLLEPYADVEVDESARLLDVMILGQRSMADYALNEAFLRAGGLHFLAVSGFNVMVLAGTAWWVVRRLLGRGDRLAAPVAIVLTLSFALVTEPNAPILRATIAVMLVALARASKRPVCPANSLALAAACILIADPNALFGAAFQLTFVQVSVLMFVLPPVWRMVQPKLSHLMLGVVLPWILRVSGRLTFRKAPRVLLHPGIYGADQPADDAREETQTLGAYVGWSAVRGLVGLVLVCLLTWLSALPLILWHFGRFSSWGWAGTVLLTLPVTAVTILSLATMAANAVSPLLGAPLQFLLERLSALLLRGVGLFEHLPGAVVHCQQPPLWLVIASYGVLLLMVAARGTPPEMGPQPTGRRPPPVQALTLVKIGTAVLLVLAWLGWVVLPASQSTGPALHVLAAGNGNAILLTSPDGSTAVLDVGTDTNSDIGETAARALRAIGMRAVDTVLVSHGNVDHYSGLPTLLERVPVTRWLTNAYFADSSASSTALAALAARLPPSHHQPAGLHAGDQRRIGDATVDVLWPPAGLDSSWSVNDCSLALRVTIGGHRVLTTGDLEERGLLALLDAEREGRISLRADVLIAPHHGQVITDATERFYAAVSPQFVIVSTRTPRPKLKALAESTLGPAARVLLTGEVGAVVVRVSPAGDLLLETPFAPAGRYPPPSVLYKTSSFGFDAHGS